MAKPLEVKFQIIEVRREEIRPILKSNMELIISNINRIMKEKGVFQEDLAYGICSEQSHVSKILSNRNRGLTINVLGRIAKALDVKMHELLK
jgi:antitoxin component HigA of HigAB toxin-antitoxin module